MSPAFGGPRHTDWEWGLESSGARAVPGMAQRGVDPGTRWGKGLASYRPRRPPACPAGSGRSPTAWAPRAPGARQAPAASGTLRSPCGLHRRGSAGGLCLGQCWTKERQCQPSLCPLRGLVQVSWSVCQQVRPKNQVSGSGWNPVRLEGSGLKMGSRCGCRNHVFSPTCGVETPAWCSSGPVRRPHCCCHCEGRRGAVTARKEIPGLACHLLDQSLWLRAACCSLD